MSRSSSTARMVPGSDRSIREPSSGISWAPCCQASVASVALAGPGERLCAGDELVPAPAGWRRGGVALLEESLVVQQHLGAELGRQRDLLPLDLAGLERVAPEVVRLEPLLVLQHRGEVERRAGLGEGRQ
jgi:hypothetical protein